jgi:hypothetical protein
MHDLQEKGYRYEMEMHMVLFECLWLVYADLILDTRERLEDLLGADWTLDLGWA